jgi:hypothetical protein
MSENDTEPVGVETPEDDAADQHIPVRPQDETTWTLQVPLDADEADAVEQEHTVELDEDDYR